MNILSQTADAVGEALNLDIRLNTRLIEYVEARAIYYNICRNKYDFTFVRIGKEVGRDHASVIHGLKAYENWMATDSAFREKSAMVEKYVIGGEIVPNEHHTPCDELVSENKRLKIQIKELNLRAETLEHESNRIRRLSSIIDRLQYQIPRGKEIEAEKQINRFLNGLRL